MAVTDFLLDSELMAKIKGIQIRARHLVNDVFAGEYQSAFRGRGLEFEEVREYQPGDDITIEGESIGTLTGNPRDMGRQLRSMLEDLDLAGA